MSQEEWLMEFQVLNGRKPTEAEIARAAKNYFQPQGKPTKQGITFDKFFFAKALALLILAVFGYIVGFLFA